MAARAPLQAALEHKPDSHWLLTRTGLTHYEERAYATALHYTERAHAQAPKCPLVLWDLAGTYDMLGRTDDALRLYRRLIRRGPFAIAYDECGEGLPRARGLVCDSHYRVARILERTGRVRAARNAYDRHLAMRGPGCQPIYPLARVRRERAALETG